MKFSVAFVAYAATYTFGASAAPVPNPPTGAAPAQPPAPVVPARGQPGVPPAGGQQLSALEQERQLASSLAANHQPHFLLPNVHDTPPQQPGQHNMGAPGSLQGFNAGQAPMFQDQNLVWRAGAAGGEIISGIPIASALHNALGGQGDFNNRLPYMNVNLGPHANIQPNEALRQDALHAPNGFVRGEGPLHTSPLTFPPQGDRRMAITPGAGGAAGEHVTLPPTPPSSPVHFK